MERLQIDLHKSNKSENRTQSFEGDQHIGAYVGLIYQSMLINRHRVDNDSLQRKNNPYKKH